MVSAGSVYKQRVLSTDFEKTIAWAPTPPTRRGPEVSHSSLSYSSVCMIPFFEAQVRGKKTRSARVFPGAGVQDSVRTPLAAVPIGPDLGYFYIKNPPSLAVLLSWI